MGISSRELSKKMHACRNLLPSGYSWNSLQDAFMKALKKREVYLKLSDQDTDVSTKEVFQDLDLVVDSKVENLMTEKLKRRGELLPTSRYSRVRSSAYVAPVPKPEPEPRVLPQRSGRAGRPLPTKMASGTPVLYPYQQDILERLLGEVFIKGVPPSGRCY